MGELKKRFKVLVDDNFHFMDESERYEHASFNDEAAAVQACKEIVSADLKSFYKPGMSAENLYEIYVAFGSDPFICPVQSSDVTTIQYSSWDYAKERSKAIVSNENKS